MRYLRTVLGEGTTDGATRARLGRSWGFCARHAWQFLGLEWGNMQDSLGAATILEGLVEAAEKTIAALLDVGGELARPKGWRRAVVERLVPALEPAGLCPACRVQADHEAYAATVLVRNLNEPEWRRRLADSDGLCLRHCREALRAAETPERLRWLLEEQRRRLHGLKAELEEHGRKHDYRFSHERYGKEGDVAVRATDALAGSWFRLPRRPRAVAETPEGPAGV